ncbi:hypothetical protein L6252_00525, partial [Candidatus Parcubacteria bacterium]|nr:hypothetical protein [Candidatus Parcubacteria bacterium]
LLKKFSIGSNVLEIKRKNKKHSIMYRLSLSGYNLRLFSLKIGLTLKRKDKLLREFLKKKEKQDCMPIEKLVFCKKKEKNLTHSQLNALGIYLNLHRPSLTRKPLENFIKLGEFSELKKFLNFRYEKIKKIKISHRTEEVYDFTVKNTHTFVANGICSSNCHQLSKEAANALLKTLEEPPSHAVFILATTELHKMISTILSRCQTFIFHKLSQIELVKLLETTLKKEGVKYEKEALEMLCFSSHGAARDAQTLLDQAITLASDKLITKEEVKIILGLTDKQAVFEFLSFLSKKEKKKAVEQINKIYFEGIDLAEFLSYVLAYLRLILILQIDNQTQAPLFLALNKEEKEQALKLSQEFEEKRVKTALEFLLSAENKIKFASIPQLPLELAILDICQ